MLASAGLMMPGFLTLSRTASALFEADMVAFSLPTEYAHVDFLIHVHACSTNQCSGNYSKLICR